MTIHLEYEASKQLDLDYNSLINKVIYEYLNYEDCPYETEISILLTDDDGIKEINNQFRGIDKPTDVLSFPTINLKVRGILPDWMRLKVFFNPETMSSCLEILLYQLTELLFRQKNIIIQ